MFYLFWDISRKLNKTQESFHILFVDMINIKDEKRIKISVDDEIEETLLTEGTMEVIILFLFLFGYLLQ